MPPNILTTGLQRGDLWPFFQVGQISTGVGDAKAEVGVVLHGARIGQAGIARPACAPGDLRSPLRTAPLRFVRIALCTMSVMASLLRSTSVSAWGARIRFLPDQTDVAIGQISDVQLVVENVINLYGLEFQLRYDPVILEVIDADPELAGTQIEQGEFLSPDFVVRNEVDVGAGTIWYAVTQLNPRPPVNGSGTVLTVRFRAKALGVSMLDIDYAQLVSPKGLQIDAEVSGGVVLASTQGATQVAPLPTFTPTPAAMYTYTPSPTEGPAATIPTAPTGTPGPEATLTRPPTRLIEPPASPTPAGGYPYPLSPSVSSPTPIRAPVDKPTSGMPGETRGTSVSSRPTVGPSQTGRPESPEIAVATPPPEESPPSLRPESARTQLAPTQPLGKLVAVIPTAERCPTAKLRVEESDALIPPEIFTCAVVLLVLFTIVLAIYLLRNQEKAAR